MKKTIVWILLVLISPIAVIIYPYSVLFTYLVKIVKQGKVEL